jgi:hypothetical protein
MAHALAEYSFLQNRLSFWLNYDYKPPTVQGNLLSAVLTLYQGAVIGGFVRPGRLPESMLVVAGTASLFSGNSPERPYKKPTVEEAPGAPLQEPKEVERFGPIVNNSDVKIIWRKGIEEQGEPLENYLKTEDPELVRLAPKATTFDLFRPSSGEAISAKAMNTLIVLVPTDDSTTIPAHLHWGSWNERPAPEYHVAALRHWRDAYGAELVGLGRDTIDLKVARKPATRDEALELARVQYAYCNDIIDQGTGSYSVLAAGLMADDWWFFWWD